LPLGLGVKSNWNESEGAGFGPTKGRLTIAMNQRGGRTKLKLSKQLLRPVGQKERLNDARTDHSEPAQRGLVIKGATRGYDQVIRANLETVPLNEQSGLSMCKRDAIVTRNVYTTNRLWFANLTDTRGRRRNWGRRTGRA